MLKLTASVSPHLYRQRPISTVLQELLRHLKQKLLAREGRKIVICLNNFVNTQKCQKNTKNPHRTFLWLNLTVMFSKVTLDGSPDSTGSTPMVSEHPQKLYWQKTRLVTMGGRPLASFITTFFNFLVFLWFYRFLNVTFLRKWFRIRY